MSTKDVMSRYGNLLLTRVADYQPIEPDLLPHVPLDVLTDILEGRSSMRILGSFDHVSDGCEICLANIEAFTKNRWVVPPACLRCSMAGMCAFKEDPTECESLHVCNGTDENAKFRGQPCAMRGGFPTFFATVERSTEYCPCETPAFADLGQLQRPWKGFFNLERDNER